MTIHTLGDLLLSTALILALLQAILPLYGYASRNAYLLASARSLTFAQCIFVLSAFGLLAFAFAGDEFDLAYVAANSHPNLPLIYKLTATWGSHEGSILLWIVILSLWSAYFATIRCASHLKALTLSILGFLSGAFLAFSYFTSDPFLIAVTPESHLPQDLNPLLQDPGLVSHPPILYMGYVGFSVAFALAFAGLITRQLDRAWLNVIQRFSLLAWSFLTLGITLGSLWAYRVLGWGGFWFWDPVENASLLPWLIGTALIHVLVLAVKRQSAAKLVVLLALMAFSLSLLGTFLVRSGILISAHTFASDPKRGVFLLLLLALVVIAAFFVYILRLPLTLNVKAEQYPFFSKENKLLLNSGLFALAMFTILIGTLYPLLMDTLHLGTLSVGPPYFNWVMLPINLCGMLFMGLAPYTRWQASTLSMAELLQRVLPGASLSLVAASILIYSFNMAFSVLTFVNLSLAFWIIFSVVKRFRYLSAMSLAHTGFAVLILGLILSSTLSMERVLRLKVGRATTLGPYQFFFLNSRTIVGDNFQGIQADFEVLKANRSIAYLHPEKRLYSVRGMVMSKVAIQPGIFRDLYIALGEPIAPGEWSLRIYYKPFIRFIWIGGALIALAGLLAFYQRSRLNMRNW